MSGAIKPNGAPRPKRARGLFNAAGRGGPRRLVVFGLTGLGMAGVVGALMIGGKTADLHSFEARMGNVDPLPGGLRSTPEQDALASKAIAVEADEAGRAGRSYVPPIAPSAKVVSSSAATAHEDSKPAAAPPAPRFVGKPAPVYRAAMAVPAAPEVTPMVMRQPEPPAPAARATPIIQVAQAANDQQQAQYNAQIRELLRSWDARAPRTDVVLPPSADQTRSGTDDDPPAAPRAATRRAATAPVSPASLVNTPADIGRVLVPAGRGIYAHPVLALNSDASSPAVFQADSGPIAGDRMIGGFSRQNDRLVIRIDSVIHNGQQLNANGLIIAPDTMEAGVASGVDQHYVSRFLLPAAAAFVQGLGQALATTSNTATVLSPYGGATALTNLNIGQQLGVAAGVAAANVGSTLNQMAPKGPTVSLDANVSVGVMFLSNLTERSGG